MSKNPNELLPKNFHARTPLEKRNFFEGAADKKVMNETIRKPLSDEQIEVLRFNLEKISIKLSDAQDEYETVKKNWRAELDEMKKELSELIGQLKSGQEVLHGVTVYEIRDYENNRVSAFIETGEEVSSRPMLPDERQSTIQSELRKVENED